MLLFLLVFIKSGLKNEVKLKKESVARLYTKQEVIDYIWQYSKFYGNKLGDCEQHYYDGDGYVALILMFEVAENICKSVVGDYESSFYKVVENYIKSIILRIAGGSS